MSFAGSLCYGILSIVGDDHAHPPGAVARPIATEVDGDCIQPWPDFAMGLKTWIGSVSAQPGFLKQVRGIVTIARGAQPVAHDLSFIATQDLPEGKRQL